MITIDTTIVEGQIVRSKITGNYGVVTYHDPNFKWSSDCHGKMSVTWEGHDKDSCHPLWDEDYGPKDGSGACYKDVEIL